MKLHLLLLLASMMASVNSCEFGTDVIQGLYDRAEVFRKTKVFDTTNRENPLTHQQYFWLNDGTDGYHSLGMNINNESMTEMYENNAANDIETISGSYDGRKSQLHFNRKKNGELHFIDFAHNDVEFTLRSLDAELPNNFQEDYKKVILDLKTMRQKMFDFQKRLSKDESERVRMFDYTLFSNGEFLSIYSENDVGSITVHSVTTDGKQTISGNFSCKNKKQKFNVVDENVAVNGEPLDLLSFFLLQNADKV